MCDEEKVAAMPLLFCGKGFQPKMYGHMRENKLPYN